MKRIYAFLLALALGLALPLAASAQGTFEVTEEISVSADYDWTRFAGQGVTLNVYNWGEYISNGSDDSVDVVAAFEKLTGIEVNYTTFDSNESMYAKLKSGAASYDIVIPSDYMVAKMIAEDMLLPLNYDNIPNYSYIGDQFKNLAFDPNNEYTVPYTWGTLGIIYNKTMVDGEITSWSSMYDDANKGNVLLINNSRDAFGNALIYLGYSVNTTDEAQIREAFQLLSDAVSKGVYQGKVMDEVFNKMEQGNAAIATYYAGDYLTMYENNPDLAYVVPEEGSNWFVDAMCVLKNAKNVDEAHEWINFIASTESNLRNMDYIWYASPNEEALEMYPEWYEEQYGEPLDAELYEIMAAPQEILDRCEAYLVLPQELRTLYNDLWIQLGT